MQILLWLISTAAGVVIFRIGLSDGYKAARGEKLSSLIKPSKKGGEDSDKEFETMMQYEG